MEFKIIDGVLEEYLGDEEVIIVPNGVKVIDVMVFDRNNKIKKVVLPEGLEYIQYGAFSSCENLVEINLPSTLKNIASSAFAWCKKLGKIVIPEKTFFEKDSFTSCDNLDITVSFNNLNGRENLKYLLELYFERYLPHRAIRLYLGGNTLEGEYRPNAGFMEFPIREVHILEGVKSIAGRCFDHCKALSTITLPSTIESIGSCAFRNCGLSSINIPASVKSIEYSAFEKCGIDSLYLDDEKAWCNIEFDWEESNPMSHARNIFVENQLIKTFNIPEGITEIKPYAFSKANALKSITIPKSVVKIGKYAFSNFVSLQEIIIPDSVKIIEDSAFEGCENLSKVILPKNVRLGNNVFKDTNVNNLEIEADYSDNTLIRCRDFSKVLVVRKGTTAINEEAFKDCLKLETVVLPTSIEKIGARAFCNCRSLNNVIFAENPESIDISSYSQKGVYIDNLDYYLSIKFSNQLSSPLYLLNSLFINGKLVKDLVITSAINDYSFAGAKCLNSVTLQEGVKKVGKLAFVNCSNLKKFTLPSTLIDIQFSSFYTLTYKDIEVIATGRHVDALTMLVKKGTHTPVNLASCTTCSCAPLCKILNLHHYQCKSCYYDISKSSDKIKFAFQESHSGLYEYAETESGQDTYLRVTHHFSLDIPKEISSEEINMYILEHFDLGKYTKEEDEF